MNSANAFTRAGWPEIRSWVFEVEQARDAFLDAVVVPLLNGQVCVFRVERREGAFRAPFRLGASLELHGNGDGEACAIRPERALRVDGCGGHRSRLHFESV